MHGAGIEPEALGYGFNRLLQVGTLVHRLDPVDQALFQAVGYFVSDLLRQLLTDFFAEFCRHFGGQHSSGNSQHAVYERPG